MVGREMIKITLSLNSPILPPPRTAPPTTTENFIAISNLVKGKEDSLIVLYIS